MPRTKIIRRADDIIDSDEEASPFKKIKVEASSDRKIKAIEFVSTKKIKEEELYSNETTSKDDKAADTIDMMSFDSHSDDSKFEECDVDWHGQDFCDIITRLIDQQQSRSQSEEEVEQMTAIKKEDQNTSIHTIQRMTLEQVAQAEERSNIPSTECKIMELQTPLILRGSHKRYDLHIKQTDKIKCIDLVLRLCSKASLDPMWLLRRYIRSLKTSEVRLPPDQSKTNSSGSTAAMTSKLDTFAKACSIQSGNFNELLACVALQIEYRRLFRKMRRSNYTIKFITKTLKDVIDSNEAQKSLIAGEHALLLCWAISPRNLFGLIVLTAMSLTKSNLRTMSKPKRATLMMLFSGQWTPSEGDAPLPVCSAVTTTVRTIIPAAELMLVMNLKKEKKAMRTLTKSSNFIFRRHEEEYFGFRLFNENIFMPPQYLISDDFSTHRRINTTTMLLNSALKFKHPALESVYQSSEVHSDTQLSNLCTVQNRFFHSPITNLSNTEKITQIPPIIHGLYPNDYFIVTPFAFTSFEEHGRFESLISCLKNAYWILHGEADLQQDSTQYSVLSKEYMNEYKDIDRKYELNKTVDVNEWKQDEIEHQRNDHR